MVSRRTMLALAAASPLAGLAQPAPAQPATAQPAPAQPVPLLRKTVPSTGEALPAIGVGTARRYEDARTEEALSPLRETLRAFAASGGTVLDTAPSYGLAEEVCGRLIEELGIGDRLFIATKVSDVGREAGLAQIERSFRALRRPRLDLIAVHNLRDVDVQLRSLRELKAAGRIRYVGVTTSFEGQHAALAELMRREALDFIQVDYALDNRGAADTILPLAQERGMGVMINLPLGRGRLFAAVQQRPLPDWAAEIGCTSWAQVFLKYLVSHPAVTCAVPGMARPAYVPDNLGAATGPVPDAAMRRRMEAYIDAL